jgi:hypothetical protein
MTYAEKLNSCLNMTRADRLLWRDLASVVNDPSYAMQRRQTAARELKELHEEIDRRNERLDRELLFAAQSSAGFEACEQIGRRNERVDRELLVAALSSGSFESRAERMLKQVREFASINSKKFFEKAILRYLTAKVRNATWAASLPLLEYLALEWLRDKRALWRFLDAAFARWKDFKNPKSVRHRSILIHQLPGSQSVLEECEKQNTKPIAEIVELLIRDGAANPQEQGAITKLSGALRTQKSRELKSSKSQAKQPAIPVTIR